ncbi:MAG: PH domain-containing protein [Patescibacteria group bacterium]|jgi:uncharacterized membrane protein YdbT with pleckstrin-like domain
MNTQVPHHLHFGGLASDEEVKLFLRRHPIVLINHVFWFVIIGLVPPVAWIWLATQTDLFEDGESFIRIILILVVSLFYLFWLRTLFTMWLDYYLDVWVVTTKRIMKIEHEGMFHRKVSEQELSRIQDVTTETNGFLQTVMKFGDIKVQTAAETENFVFRDIQDPELVAKEISNLLVDRSQNTSQPIQGGLPVSHEPLGPITLVKK